jgi:hypothetical protein
MTRLPAVLPSTRSAGLSGVSKIRSKPETETDLPPAWRREDLEIYMFRLYLEYARLMSPDRDNGKMVSS